MKSIFSILTAIFFISSSVLAADVNVLTQQSAEYNGSMFPALVVKVQTSTDFLKDNWKDFVSEKYDVRLKGYGLFTNKDVLSAEEEVFQNLSPKRADMYTRVTSAEDGIAKMELFMTFGYDINIGPENYGEIFSKMEEGFREFLNVHIPAYMASEVEALEKDISKIEKSLSKAQRSEEKTNKKYDKAVQKIDDNLEENEKLKATNIKRQEEIKSSKLLQQSLMRDLKRMRSEMQSKSRSIESVTF